MKDNITTYEKFNLVEGIKFDLSTGEYADHLLDTKKEKSYATKWVFNPTPTITVVDYFADMRDDFNGEAEVELSNGDKVTYSCSEIPGKQGPSYEISAYITTGRQTFNYPGSDFLEEYASNGLWIQGLLDFYESWKNDHK